MKIIAFDMGRAMGVAIGDVHGVPICHTEILGKPSDPQSARFCQLLRVVNTLIAEHEPNAVVIEKPIAGGVVGKAARVEQAFGYRGCIFAVAHMRGLKTAEYTVQSVRDYMIGNGKLKSAIAKPAIYAKCQSYGWSVTDFEQSDAAAVWHKARMDLYGVSGPEDLFGSRP